MEGSVEGGSVEEESVAAGSVAAGSVEEGTDGNALWENKDGWVFEGVGQGELGVNATMPVRKAKVARKVEREEDYYW